MGCFTILGVRVRVRASEEFMFPVFEEQQDETYRRIGWREEPALEDEVFEMLLRMPETWEELAQ